MSSFKLGALELSFHTAAFIPPKAEAQKTEDKKPHPVIGHLDPRIVYPGG